MTADESGRRPGMPRALEVLLIAGSFLAASVLGGMAVAAGPARKPASAVAAPGAGPDTTASPGVPGEDPTDDPAGGLPGGADQDAAADCLEFEGFAVEDNSAPHPEAEWSLRADRGDQIVFFFAFATEGEAIAFLEERYEPNPPYVIRLGRMLVEYGEPAPGDKGPIEACAAELA